MKQFKRILSLVLAMLMVFALAACGGETTPDTTEGGNDTPTPDQNVSIFPQDLPYSIVTAVEFNHQVRDGLVWFLYA